MANNSIGAYAQGGSNDIGAYEFAAPTNQPPTFTSSPVTSVRATQPYSYSVTTTDPEADTITLTAPVLPAWMSFVDNGDGTGTLSGTPTKTNSGDNSVTLRAAHSGDSSTTDQSFTVHVRNFGVVRGMKGAVQIPTKVWEREWLNYFQHTSAEITKADYHSAAGSIVDAAVDGPPGFTEYNTISLCDDGTTFSNLYNPGSGNYAIPPVGNLMMSWYMKREDGGAASVGINSTTGSCYTRIFSAASPAGQVGEDAVGDGWYRGWCTVYGLTGGSALNTGLLRSSAHYANDGNSKLYVTCFQLEPIVPGVVDETTGPSPFRPTTDYTYGERKRLRSTTAWTPSDPVKNWVDDSRDITTGWTYQTGNIYVGEVPGPAAAGVGLVEKAPYIGHEVNWSAGAVNNGFYAAGVVVGLTTGVTQTCRSVWLKADVAGEIRITDPNASSGWNVVDVTTEWQRFDAAFLATSTTQGIWIRKESGSPIAVVHVAGPQFEIDTLTPGRYVETRGVERVASDNNVLYVYKGAEQPLKDFGALALGFNMDLVTDLVYDLVQDLVRD